MMLALLLGRAGVDVTILESHGNFDRDFRGDTVHPATLDVLKEFGIADEVMAFSRGKLEKLSMTIGNKEYTIADFTGLKTDFPFVAMIPQEHFLDLLAKKMQSYPNVRLLMSTRAADLIKNNGRVTGIKGERQGEEPFDILASVVIAADGRNSTLRTKSGLEMIKTAPPMDVLWFRLSKKDTDAVPGGLEIKIRQGNFIIAINRGDYWQMGYVILKGGFKGLKEEGMESMKRNLLSIFPFFADRMDELKEWNQTSLLAVQTGYLPKWHLPGFLAIGDAAHIMSPVGGVGVNYAIQDAICSANILVPLLQGQPDVSGDKLDIALETIQKRRFPSTRAIQRFQEMVQKRVITQALNSSGEFVPPLPMRILSRFGFMRRRLAKFLAYGLHHEKLEV